MLGMVPLALFAVIMGLLGWLVVYDGEVVVELLPFIFDVEEVLGGGP